MLENRIVKQVKIILVPDFMLSLHMCWDVPIQAGWGCISVRLLRKGIVMAVFLFSETCWWNLWYCIPGLADRGKETLKNLGEKKCKLSDFPGGPVVRTLHFHCKEMHFHSAFPWVQSLIRELKSCMLVHMANNNNSKSIIGLLCAKYYPKGLY